jgi:protein TonB
LRGLIVSLLLHSLPLLTIIGWRATSVEIPAPIPIQLVIEQPPPAPVKPEPPTDPPQARTASADFAARTASRLEKGADSAPPDPAEPQPPVEAQAGVAAPPPPEPAEPQQLVEIAAAPPPPPPPSPSEDPAPRPAVETKAAAVVPSPLPPKRTPRKQPETLQMSMASAWPLPLHQDHPRQAQRFASLTGPDAVRDEYCVRALNLTLRHLDLLPLSFLGARRGKTVLTIRILGDGTVNSVRLAQSSGYPEIDERIERMVFAVGQYPPLPPRMPGPWMDFAFVMAFPDPLQR